MLTNIVVAWEWVKKITRGDGYLIRMLRNMGDFFSRTKIAKNIYGRSSKFLYQN